MTTDDARRKCPGRVVARRDMLRLPPALQWVRQLLILQGTPNELSHRSCYFSSTSICRHSAEPMFSAECDAIGPLYTTLPALAGAPPVVLPSGVYKRV